VLFVLILVHEWGHFIVAKKTGMRVDEFGIGFPPKLFGVKKGETEYTFNALPIGGFVRIFGENGEEPFSPVEGEALDRRSEANAEAGEGGTRVSTHAVIKDDRSNFSPVEGEALDRRSEANAEAGEGGTRVQKTTKHDSRSFNSRPKWAQALVLIAGVVMNVLFAWLLFSVTYMIGVPTAVDEATAGPDAELVIVQTLPDSPASVIPPGAVVTGAVAGGDMVLPTVTPTSFTEFVTTVAPESIEVTYELSGESTTVTIVPEQGLVADEPERYVVGASLALVEDQSMSFFDAITTGAAATWDGLQAITTGLFTLISQIFTGSADFTQVAGPVGIVGMVEDAAAFGITALLTFTAIISLNLAVINLLPVPALDGGRLVFVAIETVTGKDIPAEWAGRINLVGFALLLLLMVLVTYNDILNLL
jgi:regulator of sigma E protease